MDWLAVFTGKPTTVQESLWPPPQGEGDHAVVEGVCLCWWDTPPVSFADSPLSEGAKREPTPLS